MFHQRRGKIDEKSRKIMIFVKKKNIGVVR
jgi:hypothetical protein